MDNGCFENPYIREFTGEILEVIERDGKFHVVLDNTYFYPGSELIPMDLGSINSVAVNRVYREGDKIFHEIDSKPSRIHRVKCSIDYKRRFDFMQQAMGLHIISAAVKELFNLNIVKAKTSESNSFLDIEKQLDAIEIRNLEEKANSIIFENYKIELEDLTNSELKKLSSRNITIKTLENPCLMKLGDYGIIVERSIHLSSTLEVQGLKISGTDKIKTGMRLEFISGTRVISDYFSKYETLGRISKALGCSSKDMVDKIENLSEELKTALSERNTLKTRIADYEIKEMLSLVEPINNVRIIKNIYESTDIKYLNLIASKLTAFPNVVILFALKAPDSVLLLFMKSANLKQLNMGNLLKDAISLIDGKGGGNDRSAQGGGKNNNNLLSCMDYAYRKVRDLI